MTVYNFNQGIGWASSGVEYAQAYRAQIFRRLGVDAKFVFTDFISAENVAHYTAAIGFLDSEVIWLYQAFTDFPLTQTTFSLADLKATFTQTVEREERSGQTVTYSFAAPQTWVKAYLGNADGQTVLRAEYVQAGNLLHRDFYSSGRYMAEYYGPINGQARLLKRCYYNQDGTVAYTEFLQADGTSLFQFPGQGLCTKADLITFLMKKLNLQAGDVLLIDRGTGQAQQILENKGPAKVGSIIHAEHFSPNNVSDDHILWNNYYEYVFDHSADIDFFVTATSAQATLLVQQFAKYTDRQPQIVTIPVGSLNQLHKPQTPRRPFSLITASRLASEKHLDWLIKAVVAARRQFPQLSLDIYGEGGERAQLAQLITNLQAQDYIHLQGHQDLTTVYQHYQAYASASTSEGFGLTLMEAVGSGLAMMGFDVRYGNQTFIVPDQNGYLIPYGADTTSEQAVAGLTTAIIALFGKLDLMTAQTKSYQIAAEYLTPVIEAKWAKLLAGEEAHD